MPFSGFTREILTNRDTGHAGEPVVAVLAALTATSSPALLAAAVDRMPWDNAGAPALVPRTGSRFGAGTGGAGRAQVIAARRRLHYAAPNDCLSALEDPISQVSSRGGASPEAQAIAYASGWLAEDAPALAARDRGRELGLPELDPLVGSTLRFLASLVGARAVCEIGTGAGVSGLWLLRGMRPDGILTSVDVEAEHQRLARESFAEAGVPPARARLITGNALDVLPRLADAGYDLVFCHTRPADYPAFLVEAVRLLRQGGLVVFAAVLGGGKVTDPVLRDADTVAMREFLTAARDDERLVPLLLPVGDGLLALQVS